MDLPDSGPAPAKESVEPFRCTNSDSEAVHRIAQNLLPGLATACVDNTTGDLFKSPATVAIELRKEMVYYITQRSETFVADAIVGDGDESNPDSPLEPLPDNLIAVVNDFMEDFAETKRKLWARVSGWLLSDSREDKIDDFVQEMELKNFWPIDRRESVANVLLRNVDFKKSFHCDLSFETARQLEDHGEECPYRSMSCFNGRCSVKFCAVYLEKHDTECPYKVIPCEQGCSENIMRREMDRHCITVCPMRLMNCPFYQVGCQSAFPQCTLERHCSEFMSSHVLYVLQVIHKRKASTEELQQRVHLLEKSHSLEELSQLMDVRSLTLAVKGQEEKAKNLDPKLCTVEVGE